MSWFARTMATALALCIAGMAGCGPQKPVELQANPVLAAMDARTALLQAAESTDPVVRCNAMEAMAFTLAEQAGPTYLEGLRDPVVAVQFAAAMSAGDIRYEPARPLLQQMMQSATADANVQCAAIYALHRLGDDSATSRLAEMLFHGSSPELQANAALVMGKLGDASALGPLKRLVSYKLHPRVELQARESLVALGDEASTRWLSTVVRYGLLDERLIAIQALGRTRQPRVRGIVLWAYRSNEPPLVRLTAAGALARLGDDRGYDLAAQALRDPASVHADFCIFSNVKPTALDDAQRYQLQVHAALALGLMGRREAVDLLLPMLASSSGPVRVAAAKSILMLLEGYARSAPLPPAPPIAPTPEPPPLPPTGEGPLLHTAPVKD